MHFAVFLQACILPLNFTKFNTLKRKHVILMYNVCIFAKFPLIATHIAYAHLKNISETSHCDIVMFHRCSASSVEHLRDVLQMCKCHSPGTSHCYISSTLHCYIYNTSQRYIYDTSHYHIFGTSQCYIYGTSHCYFYGMPQHYIEDALHYYTAVPCHSFFLLLLLLFKNSVK